MYQSQHGLTVIFLFKNSTAFSLKAHAFFSVSKVFKTFESQKIWCDLYGPENIDQFLSKAHIANSGQDKYRLKHIVLSRILHVFPSKALFCYVNLKKKKKFNQGQYILIHITRLVISGQSLSESHVIQSMLNFTMFLANSDQETIRIIRFEPYCLYKILVKLSQRLILFSISNAFKKSNWSQHNLTHFVLNIMIFFELRCIFQSF